MAASTLVQRISDLAIRTSTEIKSVRTLVNTTTGDITTLSTSNKSNLVSALNELKSYVDSAATVAGNAAVIDDSSTSSSTKTYSIDKIISLVNGAISALTNGAPAALDQLNELANALGNDANFASTITLALSNRVRTDVADQGLTIVQKANARANIGADITTTEIGNPDTNFVTLFNSGLV